LRADRGTSAASPRAGASVAASALDHTPGPDVRMLGSATARGGEARAAWGELPELAAQGPEERAELLGEELRFLERGEVTSPRHLPPALYVEEPLRPLAWRGGDVLREERESCRRGLASQELLHALGHPAHRTCRHDVAVGLERGFDGAGHPV